MIRSPRERLRVSISSPHYRFLSLLPIYFVVSEPPQFFSHIDVFFPLQRGFSAYCPLWSLLPFRYPALPVCLLGALTPTPTFYSTQPFFPPFFLPS